MEKIIIQFEQWARLLRDVGIILGVPTIIIIVIKFYKHQIAILKEQIDFLKLTQYPDAHKKIKELKDIFETEIDEREKKIEGLKNSGLEKQKQLEMLYSDLADLKYKYAILNKGKESVDKGIREDAIRKLKLIHRDLGNSKKLIEEYLFGSGTYGSNVNRAEQEIMEREGWIEIRNGTVRITSKGLAVIT